MEDLSPVINRIIPINPKVIFDTNAYRNFAEKYLRNNSDFLPTIERFKECEKRFSTVPSSNLISILELYQHVRSGDKAERVCRKAIGFSFIRSYTNGSFKYEPLFEVDIASKTLNKYLEKDLQIDKHFLKMHVDFCNEYERLTPSAKEVYIDSVNEKLRYYKEGFFAAIIQNIQKLFPSFDTDVKKFSKIDSDGFKKKFKATNDIKLYIDLATSLYNGLKRKFQIDESLQNKEEFIIDIAVRYQPALYSYIVMWKKFMQNTPNSQSQFLPNKNDLIDSLILFSIIPDENIYLVTDEKMIHRIFEEIGRNDLVFTLDKYLEKIGFLNN